MTSLFYHPKTSLEATIMYHAMWELSVEWVPVAFKKHSAEQFVLNRTKSLYDHEVWYPRNTPI